MRRWGICGVCDGDGEAGRGECVILIVELKCYKLLLQHPTTVCNGIVPWTTKPRIGISRSGCCPYERRHRRYVVITEIKQVLFRAVHSDVSGQNACFF
jgi:hypothetical protein